ncbi:MAG: serine protein kinase RIO [Methanoregula sp.]
MKIDKKEEAFDKRLAEMGIRIKDADTLKVSENVFDEVTLLALYKLVHKKWITAIGGSISTGKEANVFLGEREEASVAIKIYRIQSANFTTMSSYIQGDRRFSNVKKSKKDLIFAWTKKEFSNLVRAKEAGIPVPEPLVWDRNILIMSFLGEDECPYPQIRNVEIEDTASTYEAVLAMIDTLYKKAELVHGDLSEFNILYHDKPYLIDMGQSVTRDHPRALQFLMRDIRNVNRFFKKRGCTVKSEYEIFSAVTGLAVSQP